MRSGEEQDPLRRLSPYYSTESIVDNVNDLDSIEQAFRLVLPADFKSFHMSLGGGCTLPPLTYPATGDSDRPLIALARSSTGAVASIRVELGRLDRRMTKHRLRDVPLPVACGLLRDSHRIVKPPGHDRIGQLCVIVLE